MNKALLLVSVAVVAAAPARALTVFGHGEPASVSAWATPLAGAFSAAGSENVSALGSAALTSLSTPGENNQFPFQAAPQTLELLAASLAANGVTPEAFAAQSTAAKLQTLKAAAGAAETKAASEADEALAGTDIRITLKNHDAIEKAGMRASAVSLYLNDERKARVEDLHRRADEFRTAWSEKVGAFLFELPHKISTFDENDVLQKTEDGWVFADASPAPIDGPLKDRYDRRATDLQFAPQGTWTEREAALLSKTLDRPDVAAQLAAEGGDIPALKAAFEKVIARSRTAEDRPLQLARAAFRENARTGAGVAARHIATVEKRYNKAIGYSSATRPITARIIDSIRNGDNGLPAWDEMHAIRRQTQAKLTRNGFVSIGFIAANSIGMATSVSADQLSTPWKLAVIAFMFLPVAFYIYFLWQRDETLSWLRVNSIDDRLR